MTPSRRNEPFRYLFVTPESCLFQIQELNGKSLETRQAPAELIDWHKSGCKMATSLDLRAEENDVKLTIEFPFAEERPLVVTGEVRWQLAQNDGFVYGIRFLVEEDMRERIKVEIRQLAAAKRINAE